MGEKTARQGPRAAAARAGERYRLTFHGWHPAKSSHEFGRELSVSESPWDCGRCRCSPCPVSFLCLSPAFCPSSIEPLPTARMCGCPAAASRGPSSSGTFCGGSQLPLPAGRALCLCVRRCFAFPPGIRTFR